jgi:hypothetical protein
VVNAKALKARKGEKEFFWRFNPIGCARHGTQLGALLCRQASGHWFDGRRR